MRKTRKFIKQGWEVLGQRMAKVSPFSSRPSSPSPSACSAASGAVNDLDVRQTTSVSSHRKSLAGAVERESLPDHPLERDRTSNARPRSTPPSQTAIPPIVINNGLPGEGGGISNLKEEPGPQSPNQE